MTPNVIFLVIKAPKSPKPITIKGIITNCKINGSIPVMIIPPL